MNGILADVLLPLALGIIMLGLGLSLTVEDFLRVARIPRAVFVGLFVQTIVLPAVCYGIAVAFALPPELAVGLMLLSASPGGATANLFSHLAKGDVALNITLTATNSLLSLVTLPFIVQMSLKAFLDADQQIPIQPQKVVQVFAIVLVPVVIGMAIRRARASLAISLDKPVRTASAVFLALVVVASILKERANVGGYIREVGLSALAFNLVSLAVGYFVPLLVKLPKKQAIAIGMEIGIHNATLAIAVANNVLGNSKMAIPPAVYGVLMFGTAAAFSFVMNRRADEPDQAV
jgi:bile acid:Na+ symporter, BASS family